MQSVYERLGHAEVVRVDLTPNASPETSRSEFQMFADTYFQKQFQKTPFGMLRLVSNRSGPTRVFNSLIKRAEHEGLGGLSML